MILSTLYGYSDSEGEIEGGELVCAIERSEDGYRLLVEHNGEIQIHENHVEIATTRGKAAILRENLVKEGWVEQQ
jgi:hypothetical protein